MLPLSFESMEGGGEAMPETVFFPYKYASQALDVSVGEIRLDGEAVSVSDWVDSSHLSVNLAKSGSWEKA